MKKRISILIFLGVVIFGFSNTVSASSVSVSTSKSSITKGSSVTIYVTVNSDSPLASVEGSLSCSGAGTSGGLDLTNDYSDNGTYKSSKSVTLKATMTGTISCSTSGVRITNMSSGSWQSLNNGSVNVSVSEAPVVTPKTYSSNNYLKSLSIEGYEISFDKDTLEYSIEVENSVKSVKVNATTEDSKASISGDGEKEVAEGANKLEVKVTAENGNEKVYIINVNVKELDPIEVKVDKKKYTIIRKEGVIDAPSEYYEKTTIKIGEDEVLAYTNKNSKITLVGLKDEEGNASYYIYNDGKYTLYNEYNFGNIILYLLDFNKKDIPEGTVKSSFKYGDKKIVGYKINNSKYYFIYGMNVATGKKNIYLYDDDEKNIIKYNSNILDIKNDNTKDSKIYYIIGGIILSIIVIVIAIILMRKPNYKKNKKIYNKSNIKKNKKIKALDNEREEDLE